jgi:hypothetical protein
MKMVVHETKSKDFGEIDPKKTKSQGLQKVLVRGVERKPREGSMGYDMIDGRCLRHEKPGNAGHGNLRIWSGWIIPHSMDFA